MKIFHYVNLAFILALLSLLPCTLLAEELVETKDFTLIKYSENGAVPEAHRIVSAHNGDYIIAGSLGYEAWAGRVDQSGRLKWQYKLPPKDFPAAYPTSMGQAPIYWSAVIMPDDSVFLCGELPRKIGTSGPGLITHLDKDGKLISQSTPIPHPNGPRSIARIQTCALMGDEIIGLGTNEDFNPIRHATKEKTVRTTSKPQFWLFALDLSGKLKWQKLIDQEMVNFYPGYSLIPHRFSDNGLGFVATIGGGGTEIVRTDATGNVTARKSLRDVVVLAQPTDPSDTTIQLVRPAPEEFVSILLNDKLEVIDRKEARLSPGSIYRVYRQPDGTLFLFGDLGVANYAHTGVMTIEPTLEHEDTLVMQPDNIFSLFIRDAVPTPDGGFATAWNYAEKDPSGHALHLSFIKLKQEKESK